jgi:tetratricopeptide (TPR) repeat protein
MKKGLSKDSRIADMHYNLGLAYLEMTKSSKKKSYIELAEKEFSIATELNANMPHTHTALGKLYFDLGEYEKAIIRFRLALGDNPRDIDVWRLLGETYLAKGDPYQAQNCFQKALEMQPESKSSHLGLGKFYLNEGRYEEAIGEFKAVVALDDLNEDGWYSLGLAWIMRGDAALTAGKSSEAGNCYGEAVKALRKAREIDPQLADASYNLGLTYLKLGKKLEAQKEWEYTVSVDKNHARALYNLALLYRRSGRGNDSLEMFCRFLAAEGGKFPTEAGAARQAIESRGYKCRN